MQKTQPGHPQLKKIVDKIGLLNGTDAALPKAEFERSLAFLRANYPRRDNEILYGQLLTMALKFAAYRVTAAGQLFALSSVGLPEEQTENISVQTASEPSPANQTTANALSLPTTKRPRKGH